jgi:hypothetical protein
MVPLYAARIEDLGPGDIVKVDCAACGNTALLAPAFLHRLGLYRRDKVPDLRGRVRCYCCGFRGPAAVHTQRELGVGSAAPCRTDPWGRGKEGEPILRLQ